MTWVKICATTNLSDAQASVAAGANALGFIFAPSTRRIEAGTAAEIIAALPAEIEKIGVFVNETPERIAETAQQAGLSGCQLHGDEPAASLPDYRRALGGRRLIKTLQVRELLDESSRVLQAYLGAHSSLDALLLDSGRPGNRGGTGRPRPSLRDTRAAGTAPAPPPRSPRPGSSAHRSGRRSRRARPCRASPRPRRNGR